MQIVNTFRHPDNGRVATIEMSFANRDFHVTCRTLVGESVEVFDPRDYEDAASWEDAMQRARNDAVDHAKAFIAEHPTNTEVVVRVMERARSGPLMQAFVIDALAKAAAAAANIPDNAFGEHAMISAPAWRECARELKEVLDKHLGS